MQKENLISEFLIKLGKRLEEKRKKRSLSQKELAECLSIDRSTLSKYESGDRDMQVSMLPLFSTYCKFPIYELFPKDDSQAILDTFSTAVTITVNRKKRRERLEQQKAAKSTILKKLGKSEKILKGQIYDVNGKEIFEPVPPAKTKTLREQYKDAELHTEYGPCSEVEFYDFVKAQGEEFVDVTVSAGQFLKQIEYLPNKETLKGAIADYIIDEIVINNVTNYQDEMSKRVYAYYRMLYNKYRNLE